RRALLTAGAYLLAAAIALAPWSAYATSRRGELTPITSSSWSALFVGSYLPAHGRIFELREKLGDEARAYNPDIRHVRNENLRTEWILALHLLVSAAGLGGLLFGLWRTRHPVLWAILATVLTATAVNSFFVSEARHNVRLVPLLVAGGAAGVALGRVSGRARAGRSEPPRADASA